MITHKIPLFLRKWKTKIFPPSYSRSVALIIFHWLELPLSLTNFHGPKVVRAIEVWL